MINSIIDAVSIAINMEFGDNYEIYTESVEQGLNEPCFFITCLNPTNKLFVGKKYFRRNQFCIQFFPHNFEKNFECNVTMERLFGCLENIEINGDIVRGTKINAEIIDGVLNFFINYDIFVYKVEQKINMGDLEQNQIGLKG